MKHNYVDKKYSALIKTVVLFFISIHLGLSLSSQEISPMLVGNNVWYIDPSDQVWELTKQAGVSSLRIGGHSYDDNMPSKATLLNWVKRIQAMGAEPIMQVSQYQSATVAADLVKYFNVDLASGKPIKYWNIGNEPWLQADRPSVSTSGALVAKYFKPIAIAMKAVDSTLKIYGPDYCYYIDEGINDLFGGANDISGKIPGKDYYYCDGISWHRYPQDGNINLAYEGIEDFKGSIIKCKTKVDEVNALHNRTGDNALGWGIGEYNAKGGSENHTWENGQMFGGVLDLCMKYGATYATTWSMFENGGNRQGTDFSFIDGAKMTPRPSYRHMQMVALNFNGNYIDGTSSLSDIIVFGSRNADTISVMIMNRANKPAMYTLHLNSTDSSENEVQLNVNADTNLVFSDLISAKATHTLVFKNNEIIKIDYTNTHFENDLPPVQSVVIKTSTTPNVPSGLISPSSTYKTVYLQWSVNANDTISGYIIERKAETEPDFKFVAMASNEATAFEDKNLKHLTTYLYRIQAYNTAGKSDYSEEVSVTTPDLPEQVAFNGPHAVPGIIQIEDFDDNDEGIGYHDSDAENKGGQYRTNQGVDIEKCTDSDGGYNIGYVVNGEWLEYTIATVTEGTYDIAMRCASNTDGTKKAKVYLNNSLLGTVSPKNTAGWQNWETLVIQDVDVLGGDNQILKLSFEGEGFNLNWIEFGTDLGVGLRNNNNFEINAYYNKANSTIRVEAEKTVKQITITLIDIMGRKHLQTSKRDFVSGEFYVSVPQGLYILTIESDASVVSNKVLIN